MPQSIPTGRSSPAGNLSRSQWRVVALASLGGSLEYYDFVIYGIFAQYIARQFFPASDPYVSLILSFSVLAIGFLGEQPKLFHLIGYVLVLAGVIIASRQGSGKP